MADEGKKRQNPVDRLVSVLSEWVTWLESDTPTQEERDKLGASAEQLAEAAKSKKGK